MKVCLSQLKQAFFGLPVGYKQQLEEEIFNLSYYGGGGFPIDAVYDLPVIRRKFYLQLLSNAKQKEKDAMESGKSSNDRPPPTPERYAKGNYDFNQISKK